MLADAARAVAVLFGDTAAEVQPGRGTKRIALAAVRVKGVPTLSVEEALWTAAELLQTGDVPGRQSGD